MNFFKYLHQFVNQSFKKDHENILNNYFKNDDLSFNQLKKNLKKELYYVKKDLIENTNNSTKNKYKTFINKYKTKIISKFEFDNNDETSIYSKYIKDIKKNPTKYLKYMLFMNQELEKIEGKLFQALPIRNDVKNKYITIDNSSFVYILNIKNTHAVRKDKIRLRKAWNNFFNLDKFKLKNYDFNEQIQTDGFSVSINFIHKDEIYKKENHNNNKLKKRLETIEINKLSDKEKKKIQDKNKKEKEKKEEEYEKYKIKMREERKEKKKNMSKEEKEKNALEYKIKKNEFNYIEDLINYNKFVDYLKSKFENKKAVLCDPGQRAPLYTSIGENISYKDGKNNEKEMFSFEYSNKMRLRETKRLKYNDEANKIFSKDEKIKEIHDKLCNLKSKTLDIDKFYEFYSLKIELRSNVINRKNNNVSYDEYLRKLKWFGYINKRRHEDKLLNRLEDYYGKDSIFIMGDWSNRGKTKYISTPNMGMKRLLNKRFPVYLINEYGTSKYHHKTEEECKNLYINYTDNEIKRIKNNLIKNQKSKNKNIKESNELRKNINTIKKIKKTKTKEELTENLINELKEKNKYNSKLIEELKEKSIEYLKEEINKNKKLKEDIKNKRKNETRIINKLKYKKEKGNYKLHSVLTYQMSTGELGCINRDRNAVLNMRKILKSLIETGKRPEILSPKKRTI